MTPPLSLAELVQKWRDEADDYPVESWGSIAGAAQTAVRMCADELEAALPLGRCETCRHCHYKPNDRDYRSICGHPLAIDANKGNEMMTPWPFGCSLHEPAPPAAGEETR